MTGLLEKEHSTDRFASVTDQCELGGPTFQELMNGCDCELSTAAKRLLKT